MFFDLYLNINIFIYGIPFYEMTIGIVKLAGLDWFPVIISQCLAQYCRANSFANACMYACNDNAHGIKLFTSLNNPSTSSFVLKLCRHILILSLPTATVGERIAFAKKPLFSK